MKNILVQITRIWYRLCYGSLVFDPVFYAKHYRDLLEQSDDALRQHYIRHGRREGRFPTREAVFKRLAEAGNSLPDDFEAENYRQLNKDIAGIFDENWQFEQHYLQHGKKERRPYRLMPVDIAENAIILRDAGDLAGSRRITDWLCAAYPKLPYGWREAAALDKLAGDKASALRCFGRAMDVEPSFLNLTQVVRHAASLGLVVEAQAYISRFMPDNASEAKSMEALEQLVEFIAEYPLANARQTVKDIVGTPRFREEDNIEDLIRTAQTSGMPFSLIRLGDGEGAWLTDLADAGGNYAKLYTRNRSKILETWFASDALLNRPDFLALIPRLKAAIADATLVGVPYPSRVDWEYSVASLDGLPSCMMVLRHAHSIMLADPDALFCSHDIHFDLQLSGALGRLLKTGCQVGVISCHPGLAMQLHQMHGAQIVANLCTPEEKGMSAIVGSHGARLQHFPDVFERIVASIREQSWTSTLWLVAAGYLGKIYCDEIRMCGGISIDIGSLADGWMGKKTRPTLANDIARFQL